MRLLRSHRDATVLFNTVSGTDLVAQSIELLYKKKTADSERRLSSAGSSLG